MIARSKAFAGEPLPAHLVLAALADLSAALAAVRDEMKLHGFSVPGASAVSGPGRERARSLEARRLVQLLPARQRQVLAGIVRGCANKVIAWELGLSVRTVEAYRAQLFERLGARNTADAVGLAIAAGFDEEAAFPANR